MTDSIQQVESPSHTAQHNRYKQSQSIESKVKNKTKISSGKGWAKLVLHYWWKHVDQCKRKPEFYQLAKMS